MSSRLNPYLNFNGNTAEAMRFYQDVFGGELSITTFRDFPQLPDGFDPDGTMHAMLETPAGFTLMASDPAPGMQVAPGSNFSCSLSGDDESELRGYWDKLSAGGEVTMPFEKQMWGDTFGMCVDKFGIPWMVNIAGADHA